MNEDLRLYCIETPTLFPLSVCLSYPERTIYLPLHCCIFLTSYKLSCSCHNLLVRLLSHLYGLLQLWTTDLLMMRKAQDRAGLHGGLGGLQGMKGLAGFGANLASNKFVRAAIREEVRWISGRCVLYQHQTRAL